MRFAPFAVDALIWRALLTGLLVAACAADVRTRRIPNPLVLAVLGTALVRAAVVASGAVAGAGLAGGPGAAVLGALCGLALWLPLYAVGAFGAGDVKLFAAAAAWLGPAGVPGATLYAALAGGALGLAWFASRWVTHTMPILATVVTVRRRVPYGLAITAGVLSVLWRAP